MLVKVKLLDGSDAVIQSELVTRMRDSYPQTTPASVVIDFPPRRYSSGETLDALRDRFDPYLDLADLTTPAGGRVIVSAMMVASVFPAGPQHHEKARAVITFLEGGDQQVRETVAEAAKALNAAD